MTDHITLRPATMADASLLYAWRNDDTTRVNSHTTDPVPWQTHLLWLERVLWSDAILWIASREDGTPIGTLRVDAGVPPEVSWTVAPEARRTGVGRAMVQRLVRDPETPPRLRAEIKHHNVASQRIAEACGFTRVHVRDGYDVWERDVLHPS